MKALKLARPQSSAGGKARRHFWLGATYGGTAQTSALAGLSSVSDVRKEMERVIQLTKAIRRKRLYGSRLVDLQSPQLIGGDPQKAVTEMEKGCALGVAMRF